MRQAWTLGRRLLALALTVATVAPEAAAQMSVTPGLAQSQSQTSGPSSDLESRGQLSGQVSGQVDGQTPGQIDPRARGKGRPLTPAEASAELNGQNGGEHGSQVENTGGSTASASQSSSQPSIQTGVQQGLPANILGSAPVGLQNAPGLPGPVLPAAPPGYRMVTPSAPPTLSPGALELISLEDRFQQSVDAGGGHAFATWFADDAVVLNNGQPALFGRGAISDNANWDPKTYSLTWTPLDARMGPSGDMGYTWGVYQGRANGPDGQSKTSTGRYFTVWRKGRDGEWKVMLDASADAPSRTEMGARP